MKHQYFKQVELLLKILPHTLQEESLALKGGSAINLFFRDMTRLSVDIDLCYLPIEDRDKSLFNINKCLLNIIDVIQSNIPSCSITRGYTKQEETKNIIIKANDAIVKVEINLIVRGALYPYQVVDTSAMVQEIFDTKISARCLSFADVYGGKLCACLDRQHPRDWYDIWILLENEGITEEVKKAFILYLLSSRRPIAEILDPQPLNQRVLYINELEGMNHNIPAYEVLAQVTKKVSNLISKIMTNNEREFLLSFKKGTPEWGKSGIENLQNFPAVRWKLFNIQKMSEAKRMLCTTKLKKILHL